MAGHRNRHTCGCSYAALDGHAVNAVGLPVTEALPAVLRSARKAHVPAPPALDWDVYRQRVGDDFRALLDRTTDGWQDGSRLDRDRAESLVLLAHGPQGLATIIAALDRSAR